MPRKKATEEQIIDTPALSTEEPNEVETPESQDDEPVEGGDDSDVLFNDDDIAELLSGQTAVTEQDDDLPDVEEYRESTDESDRSDLESSPDMSRHSSKQTPAEQNTAAVPAEDALPKQRTRRLPTASVLTIDSGAEIETIKEREDTAWHEIHNAYRTHKILTGMLGGVERTETGKTIAVVYYKEFRVIIPIKEMMLNLPETQEMDYSEQMQRQNKILSSMLGAEVDFIPKGIDAKTRSIVASRRDAMIKKRQIFYINTDANNVRMIHEDRVVQARVVAVADKVVRVEVFGVECGIFARDLAWDWVGDAHDSFAVGQQILVRILSVKCDSLENISITADVRSVHGNTSRENLKKCRIQGKYAGKVTDIRKGVVYVRLSIGVNAVAHSCYDNRMPGKKDDVSFAVTHIDEERNVAVGLITRIIKQNI